MTTGRFDHHSDQQAVSVLALVVDHDRRLPDPAGLRELDTGMAEAVATGAIDTPTPDLVVGAGAEDGPVSAGGLVRDPLTYLAEHRPETVGVIERATVMTGPSAGVGARFDQATLVVLALQTDIRFDRAGTGKWKLAIHKKALTDDALARVLAKLIATYTGPD